MNNKKVSIAITMLVLLIPWLYLASVYNRLPATVPTHFGVGGTPDDYGSKSVLILGVVILTAMSAGIYFLLRNIHKIDPKKGAQYSAETFNKIAMALVVFMSALCVIIISATVHGRFETNKLFMPLFGIFFAYMGNLFFSIKPNYFVGLRLPWTLESEDNWRKTHQLAARLWVAGGLIVAACSLLLGDRFSVYVFFSIIAIMVIAPVIYSFMEFKKTQKTQQ